MVISYQYLVLILATIQPQPVYRLVNKNKNQEQVQSVTFICL